MFVSERRKRPRWWTDTRVRFSFVVVALTVTFPVCAGSEDNAQGGNSLQVSFYWAEVNFIYRDPVTNKLMNETAEGKFGAASLVEQKTGLVMHVHDLDNQSYGCKNYTNKIPEVPWIALIERGDCLFTDKIKMATHTYNATAVVIYDKDSKITIMEHTVETHVSITVSQETGKKLARLADSGVKVELTIIPGRKGTSGGHNSHNSISKTSVLFVSISFIVLMIISLAWLVFYYIQRFRYAHAKERLARRLTSAAKKAIGKIPQKTVKNGDKELDGDFDQCAVCIEGYKPHDVIRTLPCKHVFHKSCVDPWLLDQRSCPMCKLDILRAYGMQVVGSQESVQQDVEAGSTAPPREDVDPSTTTDDPALPDTEVKVLLLPHTCLHLHSDHDPSLPVPGPSTSSSSPQPESPSSSVKNPTSSERLTVVSSWQDPEMQALMASRRDMEEEEEEEEEEEGFVDGGVSAREGGRERVEGAVST